MVSLNIPPDIRTGQHRTAINEAKEAGVRRIVYTSVQGADEGTAFSPVIQSNRQTGAVAEPKCRNTPCAPSIFLDRSGIVLDVASHTASKLRRYIPDPRLPFALHVPGSGIRQREPVCDQRLRGLGD